MELLEFAFYLAVFLRLFSWFTQNQKNKLVADRSAWIKVQNRYWYLNVANLRRRSEIFDNMFMIPQPKYREEGVSKQAPIELDGVASGEFEWLICYMIGDSYQHPTAYTTDGLVAILRLSHRFNIPDARHFAITELDLRITLPPALRLHLSLAYGIPRWFKTSLPKILANPLYQLTREDLSVLDARILWDIIEERRKIEDGRTMLLLAPYPYIQAGGCSDSLCRTVWDNQWLTFKTLLIPGEPGGLSPAQVLRKLKGREGFSLMCNECFETSSQPIIDEGGWSKEKNLTRSATSSLYRKYIGNADDTE